MHWLVASWVRSPLGVIRGGRHIAEAMCATGLGCVKTRHGEIAEECHSLALVTESERENTELL